MAASAEAFLKNPDTGGDPGRLRKFSTRVGADKGWAKEVPTSHKEPALFDEPALAIVGMWRMGAGANPHFALALGEIMVRVGQRYIAWTAYERAYRMKEHYWPDPRIQEKFGAHCRARQKLIEDSLPQEDWDAVRVKFEKELAFGQRYQKAYRDYEARRLAAGAATDDANFYDAFHAEQGPIATPVGDEDKAFTRTRINDPHIPTRVLFAGMLAFAAAGLMWLLLRRLPPPATPLPDVLESILAEKRARRHDAPGANEPEA